MMMSEITKEDWEKVCNRGNILPPFFLPSRSRYSL